MTEVPHRGARAPDTPPPARALVVAMRAVPPAFTLALTAIVIASLAAGRDAQALTFGFALLLALGVTLRVAFLETLRR